MQPKLNTVLPVEALDPSSCRSLFGVHSFHNTGDSVTVWSITA